MEWCSSSQSTTKLRQTRQTEAWVGGEPTLPKVSSFNFKDWLLFQQTTHPLQISKQIHVWAMSEHLSFHLDSMYSFNQKIKPAGGPTPTCYVIDWHWTCFRRQQARCCEKEWLTSCVCVLLLSSFNISMFIILKERSRRALKMFSLCI